MATRATVAGSRGTRELALAEEIAIEAECRADRAIYDAQTQIARSYQAFQAQVQGALRTLNAERIALKSDLREATRNIGSAA